MDDLFRYIEDSGTQARLVTLRNAVTPILANNLLPHFTDHSVSHSDEMVALLNKLIELIQTQGNIHRLKDDELYVLYAACYLHDIGMQYGNAGDTRTIAELDLRQSWNDLEEDTRRHILREQHHKISAEMVCNSVRSPTPLIGFQLNDTDHPNEIAYLCRSHNTEMPSSEYSELTRPIARLRMPLLAALLRMADILEESRRRALREVARTRLLDLESQVHWWRLRYTETIEISPQARTITLHFDFPASRFQDYADVIPNMQVPLIEKEIKRHVDVLNQVNLYYPLHIACPKKLYSAAEEMPEDVFNEMRKRLHLQLEREKEQTRQLLLQESVKYRQELISTIGVLSGKQLSEGQFMEDLVRTVQELWDAGGKRSARMLLASSYHKSGSLLGKGNRVAVAVTLAQMRLEDGSPRESVDMLAEIQGLLSELPGNHELRVRFSLLWARALSLSCCNEEALSAYVEAIRLCSDESERTTLAAELAEHRFLQGELEQVRELTKDSLAVTCNSENRTRERVVALRNLAMLEGRHFALPLIERVAQSVSGPDRVALLMLKAEIILLDGDAAGAKEVFCSEIDPILQTDDREQNLVVGDNRNVIAAHAFDPSYVKDFHALADERRMRNIRLWDAQEILDADQAASEGKHYEALPRYWSELVSSYRRGYWRGYWWASERMAQECLALNLPHEATLHAMIAQADKLAERIAQMLFQKRDMEMISRTVAVLTCSAQLASHATFAASLLGKLGDVIPESDLPKVTDWLLKWTRRADLTSPFVKTPTAAWDALTEIAWRLPEEEADKVIKSAQEHPAWKSRGQLRKHIIITANGCVQFASPGAITGLLEDCLHLVGERKSDYDYVESLNLLCHLYSRVDEGGKKRIEKSLFPPGESVTEPKRLQVASVLGIELGDEQKWSRNARSVAAIVLQQVQTISVGEKPSVAPGSYGTLISSPKSDRPQMVIQMDSGDYLNALCGNRTKIDPDAMEELTRAICKMLMEPENSINNKRILVSALTELADAIPPRLYPEVYSSLEPLYSAPIVEPATGMTYAEAQNPLNPFKMSMGNPKQLRGEALIAVAKLSSLQGGPVGEQLERILRKALADEDGEMRRFGFAAVRELSDLPVSAVSALMMGTRDPDPDAARMAFRALVWRKPSSLDDWNWRLLVFSLRMALKADDVKLRCIAARAVSESLAQTLTDEIRTELVELQAAALADICYSVRANAGLPV